MEGNLNQYGNLDINCVTRDAITNECITKQQYEQIMMGFARESDMVSGNNYADLKRLQGEEKSGHGFFWFFILFFEGGSK